jgi:hypothetical protein
VIAFSSYISAQLAFENIPFIGFSITARGKNRLHEIHVTDFGRVNGLPWLG